MKYKKGFTLLEAMVVLVLIGILSAMAYPSFQRSIQRANVQKVVASFENALNMARITAIERNIRVTICPAKKNERDSCGEAGKWGNGIVAFVDSSGDATFEAKDFISYFDIDDSAVTIRPIGNGKPIKYISYLGGGSKVLFSTGVPPSITIADKSENGYKICFKINKLGRIVYNECK
ncbi:GspH/FimT family pseudopilin [Cardiobacteriaceae bacterium TAE3-ERU3]|nr:GspH/FimT family pseudopilin [Cardiobacteriaceae bacterium TAE3-ERU3]